MNAVQLLRTARDITHQWTRQLGSLIANEKSNTDKLREALLRVAIICRMTVDVDDEHIGLVLDKTGVLPIVECAIVIHDNAPIRTPTIPALDRSLLDRNDRLSFRIEDHLKKLIVNTITTNGMDECLKYAWAAYVQQQPWEVLSGENSRWIMTEFGKNVDRRRVHYNLITGRLLIDGNTLKRLPEEYLTHPTYQRIFGTVSNISYNCFIL